MDNNDLLKISEPALSTEVDEIAKKELKSWTGKDYDKERKHQDGRHGLELDNLFFGIACWIVKFLALLFVLLLGIWFWHLVTPCCWRWLSHSEVQALERILFASTLISLAGKYFSKYKLLDKAP